MILRITSTLFIVVAAAIALGALWFHPDTLAGRKAIAAVTRPFSPFYSTCGRCDRPWSVCTGHSTPYSEHSGCFPLCERCWRELSPQERLPYYDKLLRSWEQWGTVEQWKKDAIRTAVLEGK